jgi:long-chain acyl-CoA synthetase
MIEKSGSRALTDVRTTRDLLNSHAANYPDLPFLEFYDEVVTYRELDERTDIFANYLLKNGVKRGNAVSFMMANSPEFFYTLMGAQKIGAMGVPISCWWQSAEVEFLVNDCRPKVLVVDSEHAHVVSAIRGNIPSVERIIVNTPSSMELDFSHETLPQIIDAGPGAPLLSDAPQEDDVAAVLYTSGTTGKPKGVMITHRNIIFASRVKSEQLPVYHGERILCALPLFHSGGLHDLVLPCMYPGTTIVLRQRFSASEFWECVERYKVNGFLLVPTMWNILLKSPEAVDADTRSLRLGLSGAAPIPPEQLQESEERFGIPVLEAYGMTENTGGISANTEKSRKIGSVGRPFQEMEVKISDPSGKALPPGEIGDIVVKGDCVMKGYFNSPDTTAETIKDGWLSTGDVGYLDEEGFLFIVDRKKELIIRGGVNIYPKELEHAIALHPSVDAVAVIPEPHDKYGQVAKACIVLKRGETASEEEIRAFCEKKMASYKVPEQIVFREGFPRNAIGKVIKKNLIQELKEEETSEPVPVAHFFEQMPNRFLPDKAKGVEATVSYNITGSGGGKWTIRIKAGTMTLEEGILKNPRVYILARDRDYHDIVTGKLDGVTAVVTGKMGIEGDVGFMAELREMMKPI